MRGLLRDSFSPYWFDREASICDQLAILWHGAANEELISGVFGSSLGSSAPTLDVAPDAGRVMKFNGSGTATACYLSFGSQGRHANIAAPGNPMTVFARFGLDGGTGVLAGHSDNNSVNAGWCFSINGTTAQLKCERASVNFTLAIGCGGTQTYNNKMLDVVLMHDGTFSASAGSGYAYVNGYQNGQFGSSLTLSAGSGITGSDASQTLYIGGNQSGFASGSLTCALEMVAVWKRMLLPSEVISLYLDRKQLFRRRSQLRTMLTNRSITTSLPNSFMIGDPVAPTALTVSKVAREFMSPQDLVVQDIYVASPVVTSKRPMVQSCG